MSSSGNVAEKTIADFGYGFNDEGQMRQLDPETGLVTEKLFKYDISTSRSENQKNYEALGEAITPFVYQLLEDNGLHRIYVPQDQPESKATFVFSSQKELKDVDKLMVIIHGSGVVRAGARSLVINHSLDAGTVLPYVKKARDDGYEVIITNSNDNMRDGIRIKGSGSPEEHAATVWKTIVQPANAKSIAVVAHSYGGHVATDLSNQFAADFDSKVFSVAFTDSVHSSRGLSPRLRSIGINFVSSDKPLGEKEGSWGKEDMPRVSAGHPKHEMTSYSCIDKLFEFVQKRYEEERPTEVENVPVEGEKVSHEGEEVLTDAAEEAPDAKKQKTDEL